MKRIEVAVGIVINAQKQVLVGQRVVKDRNYKKWEFPGGKIEPGESVEQALKREFFEETGLVINESQAFMHVDHNYPDRKVKLHVRLIQQANPKPQAKEGQALKWVSDTELCELDFLEGNQVILDKLRQSIFA